MRGICGYHHAIAETFRRLPFKKSNQILPRPGQAQIKVWLLHGVSHRWRPKRAGSAALEGWVDVALQPPAHGSAADRLVGAKRGDANAEGEFYTPFDLAKKIGDTAMIQYLTGLGACSSGMPN